MMNYNRILNCANLTILLIIVYILNKSYKKGIITMNKCCVFNDLFYKIVASDFQEYHEYVENNQQMHILYFEFRLY